MNTRHIRHQPCSLRRAALAVCLVLLFAGIGAAGLYEGAYLRPTVLQAAQPAATTVAAPREDGVEIPVLPEEKEGAAALPEEDPEKESLQKEREYVPAESVTIVPPKTASPPQTPTPAQTAIPAQTTTPAQAPAPPQAVTENETPAETASPPETTITPSQETAGQSAPEPQLGPEQQAATPDGELSWKSLITRLEADGFDAGEMEALFASLGSPPLPEFMGQKAVELYGRFGKASLNVSDEDRVKFAPPDYTRIAGGMTAAAGRRTMEANKKFYEGLYKRYGVPAPFIVAVMMVETGLGAEVGKQSALLALGSMSVTDSLEEVLPVVIGIETDKDEMRELIQTRSDWAYNELKALIEYAKAVGKDPATVPGSIYGAIGICQFMPSNIPNYAVSTNKQRPVPDLFNIADAAASVACYLSAHGWKKALTPSAQIAVLRSYNHSDVYASTVYGVATALIAPSTHLGAASARKGGNAVTAARESARASIPAGAKKAKPMEGLPNYSDLLK